MDGSLIEQIYEAAFVPERWGNVLQGLAKSAGGVSGALLVYDGAQQPRWRGTPLIEEVLAHYCTSAAWQKSELTPYMVNVPPASFFYDADYFPEEILTRDMMRAPLRMLGIGNQLGTLMPMPTGENVCITIERPIGAPRPERELMDALATMRPHLARAGLMAARLRLDVARAAVATLAALGLPAAILTHGPRLLAANKLLEDMEGAIVFGAHGKLKIKSRSADALFQQALGEVARSPVVRSIPVRGEPDRSPFIVHVVPIAGTAHDIFSNAATAVVVTPTEGARAPDSAMLHGLFDLTPAEARLARHLTNGDTVGETAGALGVSVTTVRSQLSAIFAKTGTTRQAELTGLLASLGTVRPGASD